MAADLEAVKRDYEAGMSLRAIGFKYGKSKSTIDKWAKTRGWQREGQIGQADIRPLPGSSSEYALVSGMAGRLLTRVGECLDDPEPICAKDLRSLAATLLDVRQLLNVLSPLEAEEQRLRLEGLRQQVEDAKGGANKAVTVTFVATEGAEE